MTTPFQDQPSVSMADPAQSFVPGDEPFKNVTRNNCVSFRASDKVSKQAYIDASTDHLPAEEVISASCIPNGRVAIYLSSREAVIDVVQHRLTFDGTFLELNPLVRGRPSWSD